MKTFCVYILTNKPEGVLYIGVTSDLRKRMHEHKTKAMHGFTGKYNVDQLVFQGCIDEYPSSTRVLVGSVLRKNGCDGYCN